MEDIIFTCHAVKADLTQCEFAGTKYQINGTKTRLCGTHYNKLLRNGQINIWDCGEIIVLLDREDDDEPIGGWDLDSSVPTLVKPGEYNIEVVNQTAESNNIPKEDENMKEEKHYIFHFLLEKEMSGGVVVMPRIITNIPSFSEKVRYDQSWISKKPVDNLLTLTTGTWDFLLLRHLLADRNIGFRIMVLSNNEVKEMLIDDVHKYHNLSTFSYANDSHTFFIRIEGDEDQWGLRAMGIEMMDHPKIQKRLAEICRLTELGRFSYTMDIDIAVKSMSDMPKEFFDGCNAISKDFALKLANNIADDKRRRSVRGSIRKGHLARFNGRIMTPMHLIKGDFVVVDGLDHDIVTHPENLKWEIRTTGWCSVTMEKHAPFHVAVWDTQSWINNRNALKLSKQEADLEWMMRDVRESFAKGVVPDWLNLKTETHDDSGVPDYDRLSDMMHLQYVKWQAHGLDIRAAQNLVFMATNGLVKRMQRELRKEPTRFYRKTWTEMTNAFMAGVMTREALVYLGGMDVSKNDGYMQFDMAYGLIMSGKRFMETYNLHGGHDLDDSVKVILIKIFCDDPERVQLLLDSKALDPMVGDVPTNQSEAKVAALLVRSPNGPGEYSIEALNPKNWADMPWFKLEDVNIPVVNLSHMADPQSVLLEGVVVRGIPESLTYDKTQPLTKEQCLDMIVAQRFNPGIGRVCNTLMNWAMTFGPSFPTEMLARLEQMVDMTQQGRDPISFQAIEEEVDHLYEQMVARVLDEGKQVDGLLAIAHPIPIKYAEQIRGNMVQGRFSKYNQTFSNAVDKLQEYVKENSLQMRDELPLVAAIRKLYVKEESYAWAAQFYAQVTAQLQANDAYWRNADEERANPFAKMHFEQARTNANRTSIAQAAATLRSFGGEETYKRVLVLWKWVLDPKKGARRGSVDRIMFAPGMGDSIMDVLIEALMWRGLATEFTPYTDEEE